MLNWRLFAVLPWVASAIATAADAASLAVSSEKLTYLVGETITLTVTGDDGGASALNVFGRLLYDGALVDNLSGTETQLIGQNGPWNIALFLETGDNGVTAFSEAFDQFPAAFAPDTATNLPGVVSTILLTAEAIGTVNVVWDVANFGFELTFFGITSAPGTSFTIVEAVPEPATAALLGLGLLVLGAHRRPGRGKP
jgi:PEP-CTERM motif